MEARSTIRKLADFPLVRFCKTTTSIVESEREREKEGRNPASRRRDLQVAAGKSEMFRDLRVNRRLLRGNNFC